jgi:hypothetical protein
VGSHLPRPLRSLATAYYSLNYPTSRYQLVVYLSTRSKKNLPRGPSLSGPRLGEPRAFGPCNGPRAGDDGTPGCLGRICGGARALRHRAVVPHCPACIRAPSSSGAPRVRCALIKPQQGLAKSAALSGQRPAAPQLQAWTAHRERGPSRYPVLSRCQPLGPWHLAVQAQQHQSGLGRSYNGIIPSLTSGLRSWDGVHRDLPPDSS